MNKKKYIYTHFSCSVMLFYKPCENKYNRSENITIEMYEKRTIGLKKSLDPGPSDGNEFMGFRGPVGPERGVEGAQGAHGAR